MAKRKDPAKTIRYLSETELQRLLNVAKATSRRDYVIFLMASRHGLRASEIASMTIDDIDLDDERRVEVRRLKDSIRCVQEIDTDERKALKSWLRERAKKHPNTRALFPNRYHEPMTRSGMLWLMKHYGELANIPESKRYFHVLKHTCGTMLLEKTGDLRYVQDRLGHKDIRNTCVYAQLTTRGRDERTRQVMAQMPK